MVTRVAGWAWRRHGFLRGCVVRQLSGCELGNSRTGAGEESSALLPCGRHHSAAEDLLCSVVLFDASSRSFGSERIMHWLFADRVPLHNTVVQQLLVGTRTVKPRMKVGGFRLLPQTHVGRLLRFFGDLSPNSGLCGWGLGFWLSSLSDG
jgi:hypothetical protein